MGEADGLCTESFKMGFTFQSNFFIAINQRLIVEYIYDKVTNLNFQNIISLHREFVKSVFFVKSVSSYRVIYVSKNLFSQEMTQMS